MVNYTPQWVRPNDRLPAGEIANGYCAIILGGEDDIDRIISSSRTRRS